MIIDAIATGKTVHEAQEKAVEELKAKAGDDIDFETEVLAQPKPKTLGLFGGSDAKVRVFVEVADKKIKTEKKDKNEVKEKAPLKSASMDKKTEKKTVEYLKEILKSMEIKNVEINIESSDEGTKINFNGDNLGVAIGRKGETLDAIQHLVSLVANRGKEDYIRITLNPGNYREKREEILKKLAKKSVDKAIKYNKNILLEAMNSYERRIIHNAVQEIEGVESWSIGENDHRRVCIGTSKDNKTFRDNRSRNRGGYRNSNRRRRPSQPTNQKANREPKSDNDLPLYGVIK